MTEQPKPRANKELADRYWSDPTLKAWYWSDANACWVPSPTPWFGSDRAWHVGHEAPTKPPTKMCELAGVKFPMPMREAPEIGIECWVPDPCQPEKPDRTNWDGYGADRRNLAASMYQATQEGAIQQGRAIAAAIKQAMGDAK